MIETLLLAALLTTAPQTPPAAQVASLPPCKDQLSLGVDGEGGFNAGMSQDGALLVVRNLGAKACRIGALPTVGFKDAQGHDLAIARKAPIGMHPGPVVLPVAIAAGAEATAMLHWVAGDVYDGHNCTTPAKIGATVGGATLSVAWGMQMCGAAHAPIPFDQAPLRPDPVLVPAGR